MNKLIKYTYFFFKINLEHYSKVVLVGDTKVGKTCILDRITSNIFNESTCPTIGTSFKTISFSTQRGPVLLQIWDTAGQEQFHSLAPLYYRSAVLAIIIFDLTSIESYNSVSHWLKELNEKAALDLPKVIVGNKLDLKDKRKITESETERIAQRKGVAFYTETSAKTGEGVAELFEKVAIYIQQNDKMQQFSQKSNVPINFSSTTPKCC